MRPVAELLTFIFSRICFTWSVNGTERRFPPCSPSVSKSKTRLLSRSITALPHNLSFFCARGVSQVFIHDPLYKWMLSPLQAIKRQRNADKPTPPPDGDKGDGGDNGNGGGGAVALLAAADGGGEASGMREAAERTLTRIRQKLQGCEHARGGKGNQMFLCFLLAAVCCCLLLFAAVCWCFSVFFFLCFVVGQVRRPQRQRALRRGPSAPPHCTGHGRGKPPQDILWLGAVALKFENTIKSSRIL
jgi:hypothetical protein